MDQQLTLSSSWACLSSKKTEKKRSKLPDLDARGRGCVADNMVDLCESFDLAGYKRGFRDPALAVVAEAERFRVCGLNHIIWTCDNDNQRFVTPVSCNSRICENCQRRYTAQIRDSMAKVLKPFFAKKRRGWCFSLLTLTTQKNRNGDSLPGRADYKRFNRESGAFLKLYYGKYAARFGKTGRVVEIQKNKKRKWRGAGAIAVFELGGGNNNLHLHALVYGPFIPQSRLSESWFKITGDSYIVHIEPIRDPKYAVAHILKYISKPPKRESFRDLAEYSLSIKGSRRFRSVGVFYNAVKRIRESLRFVCPYCEGHLRQIGQWPGTDFELMKLKPLYPLLRDFNNRGSPDVSTLPLPPGYKTNSDLLMAESRKALFGSDLWLNPEF